ncbi:hypothetical protein ACRYCC_26245 [Actinomadura scrupuli]|uniref:hypothetical protein n=1 Tax=Actinomadura scrupuli TaxID=559629 RepID=UPI003D95F886
MSSVEQDQDQPGQKTCPECGTPQKVNRDGTLRKHPGTDGETCQQRESVDPSGETPVADEWDDDEVRETNTGPAADGDSQPDEDAPAEPSARPTLAPAGHDPGIWRWTMTVQHPALYLTDAEWHEQNALMAAIKAEEAGHTVTGEARWDGGIGGGEDEGTVQLTYLVPVQA